MKFAKCKFDLHVLKNMNPKINGDLCLCMTEYHFEKHQHNVQETRSNCFGRKNVERSFVKWKQESRRADL